MSDIFWRGLQLFADGGDGGEGAEAGVTAPDAGEEHLRALGVPEDDLKNWAKRKAKPSPAKAMPEEAPAEPQQVATAETPTQSTKYNWDEVSKDPEISSRMSEVIRSRVKAEQVKTKAAEDKLKALQPALEDLSVALGLDPANIDIAALVKAASEKGEMFYEDKAYELGTSKDVARRIVKSELTEQRNARSQKEADEDRALREHFASLQAQGEKLKSTFPSFDLAAELKNPQFCELTRPGAFSVEDAYRFLHRVEIENAALEAITKQQAEKFAKSIRSGKQRPTENGTSAQAPSVTTFDYSKASKEQQRAFDAYLQRETAAGRKVYPGSYRPG